MKTSHHILLWLGGLLLGISIGIKVTLCILSKVDLPEEYKLITKQDKLSGYYKDNTLVIEFNNPQSVFIWEGDIKDINTNNTVQVSAIRNDSIFLNPLDE